MPVTPKQLVSVYFTSGVSSTTSYTVPTNTITVLKNISFQADSPSGGVRSIFVWTTNVNRPIATIKFGSSVNTGTGIIDTNMLTYNLEYVLSAGDSLNVTFATDMNQYQSRVHISGVEIT
jgi:hypothetical protein